MAGTDSLRLTSTLSQIGEKGIILSGGQKQRVALARAVYSSSRVVLLDDCLSAVDSPTAKHIVEHCLTSDLMHGRTCVLVTHHVGLTLAKADFVVVLKDGQIVGSGTPKQVQSMALVVDILAHIKHDPKEETRPDAKPDTSVHKADGSGALTVEEEREIGQVKWPVYMYFANATGGVAFWMAAIGMMVVSQAVYVAQTYWIRIWANSGAGSSILGVPPHTSTRDLQLVASPTTTSPMAGTLASLGEGVEYYLTIYAILGVAAMLATLIGSLVLYLGEIRAAQHIHSDLLHRVTQAKPRFFDVTPIGRIMNRFSKDMNTIDAGIVMAVNKVTWYGIEMIAVIGVIVYTTPAFLLAGVVIIGMMLMDSTLYVKASRDLKRIESVAASPMLSLFGEIIQ